MIALNFEQANFTYTKPESMTDEQCNDLRVFKGNSWEGFPCIISAWYPSREDIEAIKAGKPIFLTIVSRDMPPVSLQTENPFEV